MTAVFSDVEYVIPLRWSDDDAADEFTHYLEVLSTLVPVTVVDGSNPALFARHRERWAAYCRHIEPEPWPGRNGKVGGVVTGVGAARHERIVIADDDVRYDALALGRLRRLLDRAELVRPQNVFGPAPWHARWDTGRILLNRALGADYPGTFGLRRSFFLGMGGYDGDVLFENLELIRTIRAAGGRELAAPQLYVRRVPPTARHFWSQRVRQAYDDFAQPLRLVAELAVLPLVVVLLVTGRLRLWQPVAVIALAEIGRRRARGADRFPRTSSLWSLVWLAERSVCIWLALASRARGGVRYAGSRLPVAAHSVRSLSRRRS
jgi:hypothetical protein